MKTTKTMLQTMRPAWCCFGRRGRTVHGWWLALWLLTLCACAPVSQGGPSSATSREVAAEAGSGITEEAIAGGPGEITQGEATAVRTTRAATPTSLPVRFQQPAYFVKPLEKNQEQEAVAVQVGADISTTAGPVPLRDIVKKLATLKNMNVSWASDVDQNLLLDVDIRADEDFFQALDNLLRQVDYYHEMDGNTIIIKYKETRKFHVAMPPRLTTVSSSNNTGSANVTSLSADTKTNRWDDVRKNLDQILNIWNAPAPSPAPAAAAGPAQTPAAGAAAAPTPPPVAAPVAPLAAQTSGKGYYAINEAIGLITVTAPRPLLTRIAEYIETFKAEIYRQVSIEAKIVEVALNDSSKTGLDWSALFQNLPINLEISRGTGTVIPIGDNGPFISKVALLNSNSRTGNFDILLNAMAQQGQTKVLSNPKVSVMNGQPAVIYVGDNITYIDKVTSTVSGQSGAVSTTVSTAQVTSGIRLEVYPTIVNDKEIIMSLTPMTSGLKEEIQYKQFGGGNEVGLPKVKERTMNSIVRINSGEMLVVGGMIDRSDGTSDNKVQLLGDLPIINRLFKSTTKDTKSTELVILLRPTII